jgi:glycosyltransferase involved in cell wall biosynthesis
VNVLSLVTTESASFYQNQVAGLERLGVDVTTISLPAKTDQQSRSVADYLRLYPTVLRHSFGEYDLVHANYGLTAPLALAQPTLPVVLSLWGSDLLGQYARVSRACARQCDAVVVMSDEMAAALDRDCHVIPHGVNLRQFSPVPHREAQADVGWATDRRHVVFPYNPDREVKDFPRARRVVDRVEERVDEPVELHAVTGVPHERMPVYMSAADVILVTSSREGSPNTIKEALACNTPIVSTDVGDVRERLAGVSPSAVGHTDEELAAAVVRILESGERSNGRTSIEHLSVSAACERLQSIYEDVLADAA